MWILPVSVRADRLINIPLCEHAVAQLLLVLLAVDEQQQSRRLADLLRTDSSLTLWAALQWASPRAAEAPPCARTAIAELVRTITTTFTSEHSGGASPAMEAPERTKWADLACRSLGRLRPLDDHSAAPSLLLGNARDWMASCQTGDAPVAWEDFSIPDWYWRLGIFDASPDQGSACEFPSEEEIRRRWQAPTELECELSRLLPGTARRLLHMQRLETDFAVGIQQEKLESLRQFAYGAGHEINNPLANIATRGQSLLCEEVDAERRRKLSTIVSQAFRAHEMISDLMLFARPPQPEQSVFDAAQLVEEAVHELREDAASQRTHVQVSAPPGIQMKADRTQIAVAIKALVRNALEAIGQGGNIDISVTRSDDVVKTNGSAPAAPRCLSRGTAGGIQIAVHDTGPGFPELARRHMFDPFFSGRESGRGLGFGLCKCWRIVQLHGGEISVASIPGEGATVTLHFPAIAGQVTALS